MTKYIALFLSVLFFAMPVYADDEELSLIDLFGEEKSKQETEVKNDLPKPEENETVEEKDEDGGIFSFLNFSFLRKEKAKKLSRQVDEPQESYEERLVRTAEEGDTDAALTLGYVYLYGENGWPQDDEKAFHYYSLAAAKDDKVALNNLGSLYYSGIGTKKDVKEAVKLFEKAAELGNNEAAVNLAFVYLTSYKNIDANVRSAVVRLFNQAAEGGNITAQYMMGMIYYNGFGIAKNNDRAFKYLKQAATQYDEAQYQLAQLYMNAQGTPRNYGAAVANLAKAARQGHTRAMVWLGDILSSGANYPKNEYEAYIWYNIASVYNTPTAAKKRDKAESRLKIEDLLQAQAMAGKFKAKPTAITEYVHQTFGDNLGDYVIMPATK